MIEEQDVIYELKTIIKKGNGNGHTLEAGIMKLIRLLELRIMSSKLKKK